MRALSHLQYLVAPAEAGAYDRYATLVGPGFRRGDGYKGKYAR